LVFLKFLSIYNKTNNMGRKKINPSLKKVNVSVCVTESVLEDLDELGVQNRSKLINWLLEAHINSLVKNNYNI